jgi:hypothetical protein
MAKFQKHIQVQQRAGPTTRAFDAGFSGGASEGEAIVSSYKGFR